MKPAAKGTVCFAGLSSTGDGFLQDAILFGNWVLIIVLVRAL